MTLLEATDVSKAFGGLQALSACYLRVEEGEIYLRSLGYRECRVRLHHGELARIEVPATELARLAEPAAREELVRRLKELGFQFITLDLEGFRSGSLNALVSLESKRLFENG